MNLKTYCIFAILSGSAVEANFESSTSIAQHRPRSRWVVRGMGKIIAASTAKVIIILTNGSTLRFISSSSIRSLSVIIILGNWGFWWRFFLLHIRCLEWILRLLHFPVNTLSNRFFQVLFFYGQIEIYPPSFRPSPVSTLDEEIVLALNSYYMKKVETQELVQVGSTR
ncbi:hypothetical protein NC651_000869 [Populus alba x Populus x berolinensis]|nr:hypothetical protein NC651_000869 [Populus alba x Populus x berolinensis]